MAAITVRIYPSINDSLESVSSMTGIPKTSLILYALNDRLRGNPDSTKGDLWITKSEKEPIRFTLRMPDSLKELLEQVAIENEQSVNFLVNVCVSRVNSLYWDTYGQS